MKRPVVHFISMTIILLVLFAVNGWFVFSAAGRARGDAMMVDHLGFTRGAIQRVVKLELWQVESDKLIEDIDAIIHGVLLKKGFVFKGKEEKAGDRIVLLGRQWEVLKGGIMAYRENPGQREKLRLIEESEMCWSMADAAPFQALIDSAAGLRHLMLVLILLGVNPVLLFLMVLVNRKYLKNKLEMQSSYDSLTDTLNRQAYEKAIEKETRRVARHGGIISMIVIEIDNFDKVIERHGAGISDEMLVIAACIIENQIRASDYICRLEEEKFVVIAPESSLDSARQLGEKLRKAIEDFEFDEVGRLTISLGVAEYQTGETGGDLLSRADSALARAIESGRNRVES
ncbi:MAG: GGDEF domain-containing protein [Gemmatimonadota bacterium]|nr:GGDEF domain-containing protein [Gemmatimonadota bacterium]